MNYTKENPIGIDKQIDVLQKAIYNGLVSDWGISIDGYPRCYELIKEKNKTIEHFESGIDYSGTLITADSNKFFFLTTSDYKKKDDINYSADISIFFILNLKDIKPTISHRADEEVKSLILYHIEKTGVLDNEKSIVNSIDKVFKDYSYLYTDNMQPYHFFRIDCTITKFILDGKC